MDKRGRSASEARGDGRHVALESKIVGGRVEIGGGELVLVVSPTKSR